MSGRPINEHPPAHWTLLSVHPDGFAFAINSETGDRGYLSRPVVKATGITKDDEGAGFRAYHARPDQESQGPHRLVADPIWWDRDQACRVAGALSDPQAAQELLKVLQRIERDLARAYELMALGVPHG